MCSIIQNHFLNVTLYCDGNIGLYFCQYIFVFFLLFIIYFYYTESLIAIFLMKQEILSPNWRVVSVYFL